MGDIYALKRELNFVTHLDLMQLFCLTENYPAMINHVVFFVHYNL